MDPRKKIFLQKLPVVLVVLAVFAAAAAVALGSGQMVWSAAKAPPLRLYLKKQGRGLGPSLTKRRTASKARHGVILRRERGKGILRPLRR